LKQWPPASAEGVIFPVDVSFSNAGFTRSGQSRVKVFDMDLARRCTPLQVIEMLSYLSTVIDRPHFGETAVLEGMRQAMGEQSLRAFLRAAAQELKGLRESGRTVEGEDELYMSRGAGRTFESTYLPNGFVAILKEYESDGGHKSVPAQSNQAPGAGHEPVPALPQAPGGIDLRQLPLPGDLSAPRFAPLSSQTLERIDTMDGAREWNRIRSMLDAGMLPSTESLRVYLIRCCKDNALAQRLDAILCCMADILQAEEERGYATDPQTKLILALLESEKDCQEIGRLLRSSP
jgi:hypothetical protein